MSTRPPDVRVRLSAEGVAEVVQAFQRIARESEKTGTGFSRIGEAAGRVKNILIALGAVRIAVSFAGLIKQSIDLADQLGKLQQKTGITVETLSTLSFAARTADVSQEQLNVALVRFARVMGDYARGARESRDAIRNLFGDARALMGLRQDEQFLKIADALARIEPGARRTALAIQFFGRAGAELLPLIDDLGAGGFDELREKAEQLGLVIDRDLADAARRANDSLTDLKSAAQGMATQFAAGFVPAVTNAAKALSDAVSVQGVGGFEQLGKIAGEILKWISAWFHTAAAAAAVYFGVVGHAAMRTAALLEDIRRLQFRGALDRFVGDLRNDIDAVIRTSRERHAKALQELNRVQMPEPPARPAAGAEDEDEDEAAARADARAERDLAARLARERRAELALADARRQYEARLNLEELKAAEAHEKEKYDQGLTSLREYYAARMEIARRQAQAEAEQIYAGMRQLQEEPLAEGELPAERQAKIIKAAEDFQVRALESQREMNALKAEEAKEYEALQRKSQEFEDRIRTAQMDRFAASRAAIDEEAARLDEILAKMGTIEAERYRRVEAFRAAGYQGVDIEEQQADFDALRARADAAFDELARRRREIELQVFAGQLFAFEGEQQIMSLEQSRLPLLEQIAAAMRRTAITPEQIQTAAQLGLAIEELATSSNRAALEMGRFKMNIEASLTDQLANWLSQGITQAKSFGDAFRGLALSVVQSLQQIAAQMLATLAIQKLLGFLGIAAGGAPAPGMASGGLVTGPGTGKSDSVRRRLSNYEYVIRAAVVRRPGMLEFLNELNFGTPRVRRPQTRFAEGGMASGGLVEASAGLPAQAGRGPADLSLSLGLDPELTLKKLSAHPAWTRIVIRTLSENRKRASGALGG